MKILLSLLSEAGIVQEWGNLAATNNNNNNNTSRVYLGNCFRFFLFFAKVSGYNQNSDHFWSNRIPKFDAI